MNMNDSKVVEKILEFICNTPFLRIFFVIIPSYVLVLIPALVWAGIDQGLIVSVCGAIYVIVWFLVLSYTGSV